MSEIQGALIGSQQERLVSFLAGLVPHDRNYALLDFPAHQNVGDSAIWLGAIALLNKVMGCAPAYVCDYSSLDVERCRAAIGSGPIFLLGGGNFGDIYPWYQEFRLRVLREFPDRRVIHLPQSIAFSKPDSIAETAAAISMHPDFHLAVRDRPSEAFAREHFRCPVHLMPDSAFCLGPLERPARATTDIALLLRTDGERAGYDRAGFGALPNALVMDWIEEPASTVAESRRAAAFRALITGSVTKNKRRLVWYNTLAQIRLNRGLNMLAKGRTVVTDRLHAHILSLLLDIPHVALDNSYGKIAGYMQAWTHAYPHVRTAHTAAEAVQQARDLL